jgi:L-asparagine transporter-like permease
MKNIRSFMPNGFSGVMAAVSGVFFAYIGFDAVSVLAEESKNPQRDLPRGDDTFIGGMYHRLYFACTGSYRRC